MKGTNLGEFEEIVLLIIGVLGDEAYGAAIIQEIEEQTNRAPSVGAVHSALNRLVQKGFAKSAHATSNSIQKGRRKIFYTLTPAGESALKRAKELRNRLFHLIPNLSSR